MLNIPSFSFILFSDEAELPVLGITMTSSRQFSE